MEREKWLKALKKWKCPNCGRSLKEGYVAEANEESGWGAIWCEECRNGIWISRVNLKDEEARAKIVPELPSDLKLF